MSICGRHDAPPKEHPYVLDDGQDIVLFDSLSVVGGFLSSGGR